MNKRLLWGLICLLLCAMPVLGPDADEGYQEALRRIEEARVNESLELNLIQLNLTDLPPELGQLTKLASLNLRGNPLTHLSPEIGQLTSLDYLNVSITPLAASKVLGSLAGSGPALTDAC